MSASPWANCIASITGRASPRPITSAFGDAEYFDDTGRELKYRTNVPQFVAFYMSKCEEMGQPRPNVFR